MLLILTPPHSDWFHEDFVKTDSTRYAAARKQSDSFLTNQKLVNHSSQGGKGTKVHVYLPYRGAILFYVCIVPSVLISIFLDVECDKISCGLFEFSIKLHY